MTTAIGIGVFPGAATSQAAGGSGGGGGGADPLAAAWTIDGAAPNFLIVPSADLAAASAADPVSALTDHSGNGHDLTAPTDPLVKPYPQVWTGGTAKGVHWTSDQQNLVTDSLAGYSTAPGDEWTYGLAYTRDGGDGLGTYFKAGGSGDGVGMGLGAFDMDSRGQGILGLLEGITWMITFENAGSQGTFIIKLQDNGSQWTVTAWHNGGKVYGPGNFNKVAATVGSTTLGGSFSQTRKLDAGGVWAMVTYKSSAPGVAALTALLAAQLPTA